MSPRLLFPDEPRNPDRDRSADRRAAPGDEARPELRRHLCFYAEAPLDIGSGADGLALGNRPNLISARSRYVAAIGGALFRVNRSLDGVTSTLVVDTGLGAPAHLEFEEVDSAILRAVAVSPVTFAPEPGTLALPLAALGTLARLAARRRSPARRAQPVRMRRHRVPGSSR